MNKTHRILALLLALVMCLALFPATALAESEPAEEIVLDEPAAEEPAAEEPVEEEPAAEEPVEEEITVEPEEAIAVDDEAADNRMGNLVFSVTTDTGRYAYGDNVICNASLTSTDPNTDMSYYTSSYIVLTITDKYGNALPHFVVQGAPGLKFQGKFPLLDEEMLPGEYKIIAEKEIGSVTMRDERKFYYEGRKEPVNPDTCTIRAGVSPTDAVPGDRLTLWATVRDAYGGAARDLKVSFTILDASKKTLPSAPFGSSYWRTAVTDSTGVARIYTNFSKDFPEGNYYVCVRLENNKQDFARFAFWPKGRWVEDYNGRRFQNPDGSYLTDCWAKKDGYWYHFGDNSYADTGWLVYNGRWYYFDGAGRMKTGWIKDEGEWYYLESSGAMKTGWLLYNGDWYYLQSDGAMKTGWLQYNGSWYYFQGYGAMKTGWLQYNGSWYYFQDSGAMKTGWLLYNGTWYYLNASGSMKTGWLLYNGKWYYFESSGAMLANTSRKIGNKTYNFDANGVCTNP